MKKYNGTILKPKTKLNYRANSSHQKLIASKENSILNYVESKASISNCRITRQHKKRQTYENSEEDYDDIKKKQSSQIKNAKFEPKKFLDNYKSLKTFEEERLNDLNKVIPNTLKDLPSDNEEDKKLGDLGHEIDSIISSEHVKRVHADNELFIKFNCFDYENVGSLGKVFSIKNPKIVQKTLGDYCLSPFELLLFSSPNSAFRSAILENINSLYISDGIEIPFNRFLVIICYAFQTKPSILKVDDKVNKLLEQLYNFMKDEKPIENDKDIWAILHENIYSFLDCFVLFRFIRWKDKQIISLFCLLCRLYLDKEIIECRHRLASTIKFFIQQLLINNKFRFNSIFNEFCCNNLSKCADGNMGRAFELFTLFAQFEQFDQYKLLTFKSILISISSTKNSMAENRNPSFGQVLSFLPSAVKISKAEKRYTDLYFVYTRFVDQLTIDKKLIQKEEEKSLEMALKYFREASHFLNKRNINDKMIDLWSRSLHRIRETLQNIQNSKTILDPPLCSKLLEEQQRVTTDKLESIWSSSSDDEEDEKTNNLL